MGYDSVGQMVTVVTNALDASQTLLAGYLGVSERTLIDWKKTQPGDMKNKQLRLRRLADVVLYIKKKYPGADLRNTVVNGRVRVAESTGGEDDGTMSLLGYVVEFPEERAWESSVDDAVKEYQHLSEVRRTSIRAKLSHAP